MPTKSILYWPLVALVVVAATLWCVPQYARAAWVRVRDERRHARGRG